MIDLYFWTTPNGYKPLLFLEEAGIGYEIRPVNISKGEQFEPAFLEISPTTASRPSSITTRKTEVRRWHSSNPAPSSSTWLRRPASSSPMMQGAGAEVLQWLNWQMGGIGPMFGQYLHFADYAPETLPYAIERYTREADRLLGVLDKRLENREYVAGLIRSPIWRSTPGYAAYASSLKGSKTCGAGLRRSLNARPPSAPTKRAQRSIPFPPSPKTQGAAARSDRWQC